jgi:acetylornithine/N-succinyldiaminopimelate aminotransferase
MILGGHVVGLTGGALNASQIIQMEKEHYLHVFDRRSIVVVRGEGAYLFDSEGRRYLDFWAGIAVNAVGYGQPRVVKAICEQAQNLIHSSNTYYTPARSRLAAKLAEMSGGYASFFVNSGAEADETAIKLARKYMRTKTGDRDRYVIIVFQDNFLGRTLACMAGGGVPQHEVDFGPLPEGFTHVPLNDVAALQAAVTNRTCAIMVEALQGQYAGMRMISPELAVAINDIQTSEGILVIADEVQCGMGRSGRFFAFQHFGLDPDIITSAKALGGGVPIGATLAKPYLMDTLGPLDHGTTFGGNPLACASALATLEVIEELGLVGRVGDYFASRLREVKERHPLVDEVKGSGLMLGMSLKENRVRELMKEGADGFLLFGSAKKHIARFLPPLIITESEVDEAVAALDQALTALESV